MTRDAFLAWCHPDLLEERLLHASALWQLRAALAAPVADVPPPSRWPLSTWEWGGFQLAVASARAAEERPASFRLGERSLRAQLFCLLDPGELASEAEAIDPLDPRQWRFWLVPFHQLHPERQSIGLSALMRAYGAGLIHEDLAAALHALVP
ncbi:MAG: hypothetical protein RLZZ247_325 [Cyanobacteriota bacterium]